MTAGIVMFTTVVIILLNLVVDLVYALLDPRIRARQSYYADEPERAAGTVPARPVELELPA